jgi:hypothetical protein
MQRGIIYTSYSAAAAGRLLAKRQHINNQTCILRSPLRPKSYDPDKHMCAAAYVLFHFMHFCSTKAALTLHWVSE